jgi:L-rhamnonate dehydratase
VGNPVIRTVELLLAPMASNWLTERVIANPMSIYPEYAERRSSWYRTMSAGVVRITTDDGVVGLGFVGGGKASAAGPMLDEQVRDLLVGKDCLATELISEQLQRATVFYGMGGVAQALISGVDIALWDIKGKLLGQPVYNLLGGKVRSRVRAYASELYAREDLSSLDAEARSHAAAGFTAVKMRFGYGPGEGRAGMRANRDLVRTVRAAVGDDVDIAAEAYMGWDTRYAVAMINMVEEFDLAWVEEPVLPDHSDSYAYIRSRVGVPISGGEHEFTLTGFHELLKKGSVDILQPDVNRMGGITEARKVWALAEAYDVPVIPHSNQAHNAHLIMSSYGSPLMEAFPEDGVSAGYSFYHRFFDGEPRPDRGYFELPDTPGLGLTPVPEVISGHLVQRECYGNADVDLLARSSPAAAAAGVS